MTASKSDIASDMAKVDAYENTAADYEELPEITEADIARAVRHRNGVAVRGRPPVGDAPKKTVTIRLDAAIVEHFKARGPGLQTQMNAALARLVKRRQREPIPQGDAKKRRA